MSSPAAPRRSVALPYQAHTESLHSHRAATAFLTVLMLVFTVSLPVRAVLADDAVAFSATLAVLAAIWSVVVGGRWYSFKSDTRVLVQRVVESAADEFLIHALNGLCFAGTAAFLVKEQAQRQLQVQSGKEMFQKFMVSLVIIGFLDRWHRKATDQFKVPFEDVDSRRAFVQSIASRIPYALVKAFVYTVFVGIIGQFTYMYFAMTFKACLVIFLIQEIGDSTLKFQLKQPLDSASYLSVKGLYYLLAMMAQKRFYQARVLSFIEIRTLSHFDSARRKAILSEMDGEPTETPWNIIFSECEAVVKAFSSRLIVESLTSVNCPPNIYERIWLKIPTFSELHKKCFENSYLVICSLDILSNFAFHSAASSEDPNLVVQKSLSSIIRLFLDCEESLVNYGKFMASLNPSCISQIHSVRQAVSRGLFRINQSNYEDLHAVQLPKSQQRLYQRYLDFEG